MYRTVGWLLASEKKSSSADIVQARILSDAVPLANAPVRQFSNSRNFVKCGLWHVSGSARNNP
jgi:hypothetical protein